VGDFTWIDDKRFDRFAVFRFDRAVRDWDRKELRGKRCSAEREAGRDWRANRHTFGEKSLGGAESKNPRAEAVGELQQASRPWRPRLEQVGTEIHILSSEDLG